MIDRIGNFRVIEELGRGGFGIVYGAVDDDLDRTVAIKLLTAPISAVGPDQDNLVREARLLAEMNHPYIATVYHLGFHQDQPYIVMEFVPDGLTDRMGSGGRLSAGEAVRIAGQVCEGLAYAHKRGVIHRDIKPQNILISEGGDVKIVDFGLARGANVDSLFSEGEFGGTPHYSAPEQFENDNVNAQADVYAVGILLYQMLSGQLPFQSDTLMTLYDKHKKGIPVPPFPADLDLPEWLQNIVERAVAKDRQQRYQSAGEMLADIEDGIELELAGGAATEPCPTSCQPPPPPSPRYARTSSIVVKAVREAVQQANRSRWGRMTTILTILSLIVGIGILSLRFSSLWSEVDLFEERGADNSPAVSDMTAPEAPAAPVGGMTLQQLTKATPRIPETSPAPTPEALRIQSAVEMLQQPEATVGKTFYSEPVQILINPDDGGLLTSVEKDVAVEAPPGAVSEPMTLSYRRLDPDRVPVLPSGYSHTGRVFDIAVSGGSALTAVGFSFRSPVKIIVALSAETQAMVARAEAGIVLMHFSNSQWLELETFRYAEHPAVFANIGSIGTFAAAKSLR